MVRQWIRGGKLLRVIKKDQIMDDDWQRIDEGANPDSYPDGDILISLTAWKEHRATLLERNGKVAVYLKGEEDPADLVPDLDHFEMIALDFPVFKDGRSYSNARLLRERYGFGGELRAVGDVLRDQIYFMQRCGIDSYQVRADKDIEDAMNGFKDFSVTYQTATDGTLPVYKRRNPGV